MKEMFGIYSANPLFDTTNPLFDNNRCSWLLKQFGPYMRIEVDDGDKGQVFEVSVLIDDIPIDDIIDEIVDPQGQGRIVKSLVNEAGDVVNIISLSSFFQSLINKHYHSNLPLSETDFCMRLIVKWREPRIKWKPRIKWGKPRIN